MKTPLNRIRHKLHHKKVNNTKQNNMPAPEQMLSGGASIDGNTADGNEMTSESIFSEKGWSNATHDGDAMRTRDPSTIAPMDFTDMISKMSMKDHNFTQIISSRLKKYGHTQIGMCDNIHWRLLMMRVSLSGKIEAYIYDPLGDKAEKGNHYKVCRSAQTLAGKS